MALFLLFFKKIHVLYTTFANLMDRMKVTNRERNINMKDKMLKILVRLAHLSECLKLLAEEIDKTYEVLGDQSVIDMIKSEEDK
jgi:aldehyde:ferredoxin oxidoreductase